MKIYVRSAYYDIGEYDSKNLMSNISELPQGSIIYVLNSLAYDVEINDIYVCDDISDAERLFMEDTGGRAILNKRPDNTWDIIKMSGYITIKSIREELGITINRRKLSDQERLDKEYKSKVNNAKKYLKSRISDYFIPEHNVAKFWLNYPRYWWNEFVDEYGCMIDYVDYWDDPDGLNEINEEAYDLIKDGFPDSFLMEFFRNRDKNYTE